MSNFAFDLVTLEWYIVSRLIVHFWLLFFCFVLFSVRCFGKKNASLPRIYIILSCPFPLNGFYYFPFSICVSNNVLRVSSEKTWLVTGASPWWQVLVRERRWGNQVCLERRLPGDPSRSLPLNATNGKSLETVRGWKGHNCVADLPWQKSAAAL